MNIIDRVMLFIESENIPVSAFEKKAGLDNGYISKIKRSPSQEKCEDILSAFPKLNPSWLLRGEGEMLRSDKSNTDTLKNAKQENTPSKILEELRENYLVKEERLLAIIESQQEVIKNQSELMKKTVARPEENVICADAVGSGISK